MSEQGKQWALLAGRRAGKSIANLNNDELIEEYKTLLAKEKLQQENQDFDYFLKTGRVMPRKGDIIDFKGHKAEVLYVGMGMIELGYNGSSGTFNLNEVWG